MGEDNNEDTDEINAIFRLRPDHAVLIDYERYKHFLEGADLTDDQKKEFLEALWSIIVQFVSYGFGVHPLQDVKMSCGQDPETPPNAPLTAPFAVECTGNAHTDDGTCAPGDMLEPARERN